MSKRQPMTKNRKIPSKLFLQLSVVLSLICMFLIVSSPSAFAHSDSGGKSKSVSVAKKGKKHSSKFLQVFVKGGGKIVSFPQGLRCKGRTCSGQFPKGTKVVLEAMQLPVKFFPGGADSVVNRRNARCV